MEVYSNTLDNWLLLLSDLDPHNRYNRSIHIQPDIGLDTDLTKETLDENFIEFPHYREPSKERG